MREKLRKLFIIGSSVVAALVMVLCMCSFDSDFQTKLIAPILISMAWLALVGYANRYYLLEGEE